MRRQIRAGFYPAVLGLVASASLAIAATAPPVAAPKPATVSAGSGKPAPDRPVYSSIQELMDSIIDPSADMLWGAGGTVVDKAGFHELAPKTAEQWLDVRRAAVRIIEGGNLLMMPGRAAAPAGSKSETPGVELEPAEISALIKKNRMVFDGFAKALQNAGLDALRASDTKNAALLLDMGARMDAVCESCHQTFWYPNVLKPQAAGR
jgi:hypothetical protein